MMEKYIKGAREALPSLDPPHKYALRMHNPRIVCAMLYRMNLQSLYSPLGAGHS